MSLLLSRKEKRSCYQTFQRGKTTREIAKIVHISLKDIGKILQMITGDEVPYIEKEVVQKFKKHSICPSLSNV